MHAVTFNYRGNPLVQQARHAIARGEIGTPTFMHGHYLQDWLLKDTDYSWRLEPDKGGAIVGARRHRIALVRSGAAHQRPAHHARARRHHDRDPEAQEAARSARGVRRPAAATTPATSSTSRSKISRRCCVRFDNGAKGSVLGRPGLRRPQERSRSSKCAASTASLQVAAGGAERAVDRPPRRGRTRCCRRIRRCSTPTVARLRAPARRAPGSVGRRVLQRDARHLRIHRRGQDSRRSRIRRRSRRSKTATAPTASSRRFSTARQGAASGPR